MNACLCSSVALALVLNKTDEHQHAAEVCQNKNRYHLPVRTIAILLCYFNFACYTLHDSR